MCYLLSFPHTHIPPTSPTAFTGMSQCIFQLSSRHYLTSFTLKKTRLKCLLLANPSNNILFRKGDNGKAVNRTQRWPILGLQNRSGGYNEGGTEVLVAEVVQNVTRVSGKRSRNDIDMAVIEISQDELTREAAGMLLACVSGLLQSRLHLSSIDLNNALSRYRGVVSVRQRYIFKDALNLKQLSKKAYFSQLPSSGSKHLSVCMVLAYTL